MSPSLTPSPEQQAILDLGLATVRIRAGAGTGKTTTIGMAIANLIENHGVEPERVLGVTFTNKAASELADRIRELLGDSTDTGRQAEIHTYHGFAAQILAEFGALAGIDNRADVITPAFSRQLLTETVQRSSYQYIDITNPRAVDSMRRLGDRLGDHLKTPNDLLIQPRPDDETWSQRIEMAETLVRYGDDKTRLNVVDYADLVTLSTAVVTGFPAVAQTIRSRYEVVVLDEYQDTNPAQRVLLSAMFGDRFPVMAVGDEDQTIYEWRGASAENLHRFGEHFSAPDDSGVIETGLTLNRRSTRAVLDIANEVRMKANPSAQPLTADNDQPGEILTHWAEDALEEADWIACQFEMLHEKGLPWSEMAVLFRKNKDFGVVVEALSRRGMPIEVANIGGLLSVPEVAEIRAWLTILDRPEDSAALTQVLFGSRFRVGFADLAPLSRHVATDDNGDAEEAAAISLIEALDTIDTIEELDPVARRKLGIFSQIYSELLEQSQGQALVEVCRLILDRTRALQDVESLPHSARLTARLNIYRLLDLAEDWSPLEGRPSVSAFLDYLGLMEEDPAEELDTARLSGEEAVTLVTVHRAKGLEWDTVAIPALYKGNFPSQVQQHPDPARFAEHVPEAMRIDDLLNGLPEDSEARKRFLRQRHQDQEWRVAYVAATRAKTRLLASGAFWYGLPVPSKRPKTTSPFFDLVAAHPEARKEEAASPGERPALLRFDTGAEPPDPVFDQGWASAIRAAIDRPGAMAEVADEKGVGPEYIARVDQITDQLFHLAEPSDPDVSPEGLKVSVTGLVTMAQCPKRYFWTDVDPLPRRPNAAATTGSMVHRQIELHQRGQVPFEDMADDLYDLTGSEGGADSYRNYAKSRFADKKAAMVEVPFTLTLSNEARIRGRIDAVYCSDSIWEVVDFKSGRRSDDPSRVVQLEAYAVAVNDVRFGRDKPTDLTVTFAYLGGMVDEETYQANGRWVKQARAHLDDLTDRIFAEEFPENPGSWCESCDFLRFCEVGKNWAAR